MKIKILAFLGLILAASAAFAQSEWFRDPALKYKQSTGVSAPGCGPHYWCKDKSEKFLFCPVGFLPRDAGVLFGLPALVSATSSGQVAPIITGSASTLYGGAWKGAAISDQLGRIITGNGDGTTCHASLPIGNPCVWSKNVTVFSITNEGSASTGIDGMAFSHDSQYLFSNLYNPSADRNKIRRWSVGNLTAGGIGLTTNATYITSLGRVRNVGVYYINGQDLIYYGEGNGGGKVCVMDPSTGVETVLINSGLPYGSVAYDIMNVKVAGVQSGTKHLYVQMDGGALHIFDLAADGKSAGDCVKSFTSDELQSLLGAFWPNMRAFEVLDNETHAFFSHHWGNGGPSTNKILIYVVNNVNNLPPPPTNAPPVANAQSVTTPSATATNLTLTGTDPESTNLFYTVVTPPAHGTLSGTAPNVTYTPATNYIGADSFTFQVNDGALDSTLATVSISVTPIEVDLDIDGVSSGNTFSPGLGGFLAKGGWVMITLDVEGARSSRLSWNSDKIAIYTATNGTALSNPTDWPDASTMPSTLWVYGVEASASGPTATNCGPEHITLEALNNGASYATPYVARAGFTVVHVEVTRIQWTPYLPGTANPLDAESIGNDVVVTYKISPSAFSAGTAGLHIWDAAGAMVHHDGTISGAGGIHSVVWSASLDSLRKVNTLKAPYKVQVAISIAAGIYDRDSMNLTVTPSTVSVVPEVSSTTGLPLKECMEDRTVTFTATASGFVSDDNSWGTPPTSSDHTILFTFHYAKADGTAWSATDWSFDLVQDNDAVADKVPSSNANHYFDTEIYVTVADDYTHTATSEMSSVRVYTLWIDYFRDAATKKDWKVCVGDAIECAAISSVGCTNWDWDMEAGWPDAWNPINGDLKIDNDMKIPLSDLPGAANSWFGGTYGAVNVKCKDEEGNLHHFYSTDMIPPTNAAVFFPPATGSVYTASAVNDANPPCWFRFWRQVAGLGDPHAVYDHEISDPPPPEGHHYEGMFRSEESEENLYITRFAGTGLDEYGHRDIDHFGAVIVHERAHRTHYAETHGWFAASDKDGDWWADAHELRGDLNFNDVLDTEDTNGNGVLDPGEDVGLIRWEFTATQFETPRAVHGLATNGAGDGMITAETGSLTGTSKYHANSDGGIYDDEDDECYRIQSIFVGGTYDGSDWSKGGRQW